MTAGTVPPTKIVAPTVEQIQADRITEVRNTCFVVNHKCYNQVLQLAEKYWAPHTMDSHLEFDPDVVEDIYMVDIRGSKYVAPLILVYHF